MPLMIIWNYRAQIWHCIVESRKGNFWHIRGMPPESALACRLKECRLPSLLPHRFVPFLLLLRVNVWTWANWTSYTQIRKIAQLSELTDKSVMLCQSSRFYSYCRRQPSSGQWSHKHSTLNLPRTNSLPAWRTVVNSLNPYWTSKT